MFRQCNSIVGTMSKRAVRAETKPFTVTLPVQAIAMIDRLIGIGLHGNSRAEVARALILTRLEQLSGPVLLSPEAPKS
jgi:hypothetical protein